MATTTAAATSGIFGIRIQDPRPGIAWPRWEEVDINFSKKNSCCRNSMVEKDLSRPCLTGIAWQDVGKVELVECSSYLGQPLPFSLTTLIWIEVLVVGYIEFQRNAELDPEKRIYPGGSFDPLGLGSDPEKLDTLKLTEIKHSRLAMVAFLIFGLQAAITGKGPISFLATLTINEPLYLWVIEVI
ncbi:hypothetical protein F2Q69_00017703 [Brassica cretica]|uniref:Chlorophyll a-b binding protein, chloroplastic n=1 Tax=Brassica cretica TaxID=69181 RepID=A0A8S9R0X5_BRACR|nr:hypothetical protein F2Q69_00017703 [Brassica cretica]